MAIQVRRGSASDFDGTQLLPAELAVCLDTDEMYFKGGSRSNKVSRATCVATTPSFSSLPQTFTDAQLTFAGSVNHITPDMIVKPNDYILSTPSAMGGNWNINTDTAGQITISGTFSGSTGTTLKIFFSYL